MSRPTNATNLDQPEEAPPLSDDEIEALIEFFTILDRWDREARQAENRKSPSLCFACTGCTSAPDCVSEAFEVSQ
jgi:hypothetical protein